MRSLAEAKTRWQETFKNGSTIAELQKAVKASSSNSPCTAGLRSICWKGFLLFPHAPAEEWHHLMQQARASYNELSEPHLRFIRHPEQLANLPYDPLADDPDSPWNSIRRDETVRAEILQDVHRLPDEPFYHQDAIQAMILDILFVYCKLNPGIGGYRQGMHELLAPIVYVVAQDAVDRASLSTDDPVDALISDMLDASYIEHDAFNLFSKIMEDAAAFYEVPDGDSGPETIQRNTIVEKSKYIHEVALMKVDQELANHLRDIEVLPQIFLIRWIRLLFGREFPFEQLLVMWDSIFAFDPNLELIDFICVAMLLRIRWTLLEADYSVALQLMLKYPEPQPPHGPHTFVDDAIYLKRHFDSTGGIALIFKHTGKAPAPSLASTPSRHSTPSFQAFGGIRQRTLGARSPLSSPSRLLQHPGSVEALLQGAAKNVIERSEKLGINQAVRDAVGEIRRNVQVMQESRNLPRAGRISIGDNKLSVLDNPHGSALAERRNKRLAAMLEESITNLKLLVSSDFEGDKTKQLETVEAASANIQFVKACLEDPTLGLPEELPSLITLNISSSSEIRSPTVALDTTPVVMTSSAVEEVRTAHSSPDTEPRKEAVLEPVPENPSEELAHFNDPDRMDTDITEETIIIQPDTNPNTIPPTISSVTSPVSPPIAAAPSPILQQTRTPAPPAKLERPKPPVPTRSSIAQSSFAWMLEPDTTPVSSSLLDRPPSSKGPGSPGRQSGGGSVRKRTNPSREKNAFLFGEVTSGEADGNVSRDDIFGLQPIRKSA
ncbi:TBC1 domain family member 5 [Podospora fimiseda]|uniref:TBC1 domain family member 5 n=1 Tax=Podospora fimiseda TaxID=252190 RepID=A0AAN7GZF2_9PEZI|nr:TBC1 domain family member 5 [Podospora fimiseda]